jgi:hypothetical protein
MIAAHSGSASMSLKAIVAGLIIGSVSAAGAAELEDFVPAESGASACWQRLYDEAHLAGHPDQQVTAMTLLMSYLTFEDGSEGMHYFGLDVSLRDGRKGSTSGGCWLSEGTVRCGVDCDGGGLVLSRNADGSVLADLDAYGYIRIESECGGARASRRALRSNPASMTSSSCFGRRRPSSAKRFCPTGRVIDVKEQAILG